MKTPYFLISQEILNENINNFKTALNQLWPNSKFAYSIKTNSLPWILNYIREQGGITEAVSFEEYQLAIMCGYDAENIIFNGPIKEVNQISSAIKNGSIVNIDSQKEVDFICESKNINLKKIGIRVNVNPESFNSEDIDYKNDGFRFGFSFENGELGKVINKIKDSHNSIEFGFHLHCNSVTRSLNVYDSIAGYIANIINEFDLKPAFIDIGGGFFGGVEGKPTAYEYISAIKNKLESILDINNTQLIIEPGSAIIGSAVDLYTSVLDVKDTKHTRIVTSDGSRILIDPLWKKNNYSYSIENQVPNIFEENQIICGYTCMDHDRIMNLKKEVELSEGDKIIYHRVGAYTVTFGGPFIRCFPEVYVKHGDNITLVRKRIDMKKYYEIESA